MSRIDIVDIAGLAPAQYRSIEAIYLEAFDAPWEMPAALLPEFARQHTGDGQAGRALAVMDGDAAVGLALASYLPQSNLCDLKYLAIDPARRNGGLGSFLLRATVAAGEQIATAAGQVGCRGTLIEVEILDSPPPEADRDLRQRRINFYARHGALRTGVPFARPPDAPPEQPDWEIMVLPGRAWAGELDGPVRRELGRALMIEGYGVDPAAPWLAGYLAGIAPAE